MHACLNAKLNLSRFSFDTNIQPGLNFEKKIRTERLQSKEQISKTLILAFKVSV